MALYVPVGPDFQWTFSSVTATRPTTTGFGTTITPAVAPSFGAWAVVATGAEVTQDVYGIQICFNNNFTAATTRNTLVNIGVDNTGGTTYQTVIPLLIASSATSYVLGGGGIWYYFPLYIPAGSQIAVQATGTLATAFSAFVNLYGQPRRPDAVRCGSYVDAFGAQVLNNTSGTAVTLGTTAEGTYTQLGAATTKTYWWWQIGYGCVDTTMTAATIHADLAAGTATNKKILFENQLWQTTATEQVSCIIQTANAYNNVAIGDIIYARGQCSGTPDTSTNFIAYGLGG